MWDVGKVKCEEGMLIDMIYLDNSATTFPKPPEVRMAVSGAFVNFGANPGRGGYKLSEDTGEAVYGVRKKLDRFFNGWGPENVVFFPSCTAAVNQVLFGKLKEGDHVVVSDMEHNAVMRPLYALKSAGVEFTVAKTYPCDNNSTVNSFRAALQKNTRLVVCTAASNVWGLRLPLERIAALCHVYEIEFCVDAAQGAGIIPLDMKGFGIDYLCAPAHKGLYGPMGVGFLILAEGKKLRPMVYGGTGVNSQSMTQPEDPPERYESGTIAVPAIMGLGAGIDFVSKKGINNIRASELKKAARIYDSLSGISKIKLYTARPAEPCFVPVISFTWEGEGGNEELVNFYSGRGIAVRTGLMCAPAAHEKMGTIDGGTVRISPSIFTTDDEINRFIRETVRFAASGSGKNIRMK